MKKNINNLIKVCGDPHCDAVFHNVPKSYTKCNDCGGRIMLINEKTYWKKYSNNYFQYDFQNGEYYRPIQNQLKLQI